MPRRDGYWKLRPRAGLEPSPYVAGREWSPEPPVDSNDIYTEADVEGNGALVVSGAPGSTDATSESAAKP